MTAHCKCDRSSPTSGIGAGGDAKGCANFNDICIKEGGKCARIDQFKTARVQGPETCATQCMLKPGCKVRTHARILARARWEMMRGRRRWGRGHVPRGNGGPNTVTSLLCVERAFPRWNNWGDPTAVSQAASHDSCLPCEGLWPCTGL